VTTWKVIFLPGLPAWNELACVAEDELLACHHGSSSSARGRPGRSSSFPGGSVGNNLLPHGKTCILACPDGSRRRTDDLEGHIFPSRPGWPREVPNCWLQQLNPAVRPAE
jgi:hypothetical protein